MTLGPKAQRRRHIHLVRLIFWALNLGALDWMYWFDRPLFNDISIPYLVNVSIIALIEGAWSSYSADSPNDE